MLHGRKPHALAIVLALSCAGCSSMPSPADLIDKPSPGDYIGLASHNKLVDHPSAVVSGPSALGLGIGTLIGVPIMIAALPITLPLGISAFTDDPKMSNLQVLGNAIAFPDAVCAVGGAYAFGSVPYAIVGDSTRTSRTPARTPIAVPPPASPGEKLDPSMPAPPKFSKDELSPD
jgi:hypothetical protein